MAFTKKRMKILQTLRKRGIKASVCKIKRRLLPNNDNIIAQMDFLGAYDYIKRYAYAAEHTEETPSVVNNPYPNKIWTCWLQGMEQAPEIIKHCVGSLRKYHSNDLVILTDENIPRYINMPEHIIRKRAQGIINNTAYSDIVRLMLLQQYGGVWLDATTWLFDAVPDYIRQSELFLFRNEGMIPSLGVIAAKPQNIILSQTSRILLEYWKYENRMVAYQIAAISMCVATGNLTEVRPMWEKAMIVPNNKCLLLGHLFSPYSPDLLDIIRQQSVIQQLSWKYPAEEYAKEGTFYDIVIRKQTAH